MATVFRPHRAEELHLDGYAAYLFDWDGTLADSHRANYASIRDALGEHGVPVTWEWFNARTGVSSAEMAQLASEESGVTLDPHEVSARRDSRYLELLHDVDRIESVVAVLERAVAHGMPVALATGGGAHTVLRTVDALGLREMFTVIVTRNDAARGKPAPDIFLEAAARLGTGPGRCLVYEDSDQGVEAALAAGMDVVDVRPVQGRA
jgi:HAD superfamily hydrolase (TIGR01509 family)